MSQRCPPSIVRAVAAMGLAAMVWGCGLAGRATAPSPTASLSPGAPVVAPSAEPTLGPSQSPSAAPSPAPIEYVVRRGDTLTSIARAFETTPRSIGYWNRATYPTLDPDSSRYDPNKIEVGWRLQISLGVVLDEAPEPTGSASPSPAPALVLPPAPTPPADGSGLLVTHGPRASNAIALTFDLGGRSDPALDIVRWLVDHRVPATVFVTGQLAEDPTGTAVLELAAAHPDLFTIGNHTWSDPDLTGLTASAIVGQLTRADTTIAAVSGLTTKPLFRPPFGAQNATVRSTAANAGFPYTVMWDLDTIDSDPESAGGPTTDDIVTKVQAQARGGTIVLLHLGGYNTLDALPGILEAIHQKRLVPVTLGVMLGL